MAIFKDQSGQTVRTPDNKPPVHGTPVQINTSNGPKPGTMVGGTAVRN